MKTSTLLIFVISLLFTSSLAASIVASIVWWDDIEAVFLGKAPAPTTMPGGGVAFDSTIVAPSPQFSPPPNPDQPITPPKKPDTTPIVSRDILDFHNQVRARHGAPPLVWSPTVAASAQAWANSCNTDHGSATGANYGQNLAWGHSDQIAAAQIWYNEYKDIQAAGYDMTKGGHFTQMAWKTVKEMGCGKAMCPLPGWNGALGPYYVCEYNPPGNVAWPWDVQRSYKEHVQVDPQ